MKLKKFLKSYQKSYCCCVYNMSRAQISAEHSNVHTQTRDEWDQTTNNIKAMLDKTGFDGYVTRIVVSTL